MARVEDFSSLFSLADSKDGWLVFNRADKDGDGSISLEEFHGRAKDDELKAKKAESFNKLDKNSDGKLSLEEMTRR